MSNKSKGIKRDIKVKGQRLEMVNSLKYLGTIVTNEGTKPDVSPEKCRHQQHWEDSVLSQETFFF